MRTPTIQQSTPGVAAMGGCKPERDTQARTQPNQQSGIDQLVRDARRFSNSSDYRELLEFVRGFRAYSRTVETTKRLGTRAAATRTWSRTDTEATNIRLRPARSGHKRPLPGSPL